MKAKCTDCGTVLTLAEEADDRVEMGLDIFCPTCNKKTIFEGFGDGKPAGTLTIGQCQAIYDRHGIDSFEHTGVTTALCEVIVKLEKELKSGGYS